MNEFTCECEWHSWHLSGAKDDTRDNTTLYGKSFHGTQFPLLLSERGGLLCSLGCDCHLNNVSFHAFLLGSGFASQRALFSFFWLCHSQKRLLETEAPLKWPLDLSVTRTGTQRVQQGDFQENKRRASVGAGVRARAWPVSRLQRSRNNTAFPPAPPLLLRGGGFDTKQKNNTGTFH